MICALAVAAVLSAGAANYERQVTLDRLDKTPVAFSLSLDELVSARGEDERYAPCKPADGGVGLLSSCVRRADDDAWDASASLTNASSTSGEVASASAASFSFCHVTPVFES